jgi:hypothetical protein
MVERVELFASGDELKGRSLPCGTPSPTFSDIFDFVVSLRVTNAESRQRVPDSYLSKTETASSKCTS